MLNIENIILNTIYILFPLMVYFFYLIYIKSIDKKENTIFFELALFTSFYLCLRTSNYIFDEKPFLLFNIPLLIAYLKQNKLSAIIMSIIIILYYYEFSLSIYLIGLEYFIYYIIFIILRKKKLDNIFLINTFLIIKTTIIILELFNNNVSFFYDLNNIICLCIMIIIFYINANIILWIITKSEEILDLYNNIKKLEKEKKLRESLFKITHEIKNPIAVCKGYLDMYDINNPKHQKYIPIIKQEIDRTLDILKDFSDFTKINIEKTIVDINLLLDDITSCLEPYFKSHHINTIFEISEDEVYINADYNRLKQVIINILKNSVEAIEKKGEIKLITIKTKNKFIIEISDNGKGMSKEILKRIEEPFFTTKQQGTGLGIVLSKEIINAHNGKLEYISKENIGTTVKITLNID